MKLAYLLILAVCPIPAQVTDKTLSFDVASIKVSPPPVRGGLTTFGRVGGPGTTDPGQVRYLRQTLHDLIGVAYLGGETRKVVGADAFEGETFDIVAKLPPGTTSDQLRLMLQSFLAERFKLLVHREQRETQVYALVAGKGGPKLTPSAETETPLLRGELPALTSLPSQVHPVDNDGYPLPPPPDVRYGTIRVNGKVRLVAPAESMSEFADRLSAYVDGIVVDKTGLTGKYDCSIVFATNSSPDPGPTALEAVSQLGLKLESRKNPIGVLVVDSANKSPTDN